MKNKREVIFGCIPFGKLFKSDLEYCLEMNIKLEKYEEAELISHLIKMEYYDNDSEFVFVDFENITKLLDDGMILEEKNHIFYNLSDEATAKMMERFEDLEKEDLTEERNELIYPETDNERINYLFKKFYIDAVEIRLKGK